MLIYEEEQNWRGFCNNMMNKINEIYKEIGHEKNKQSKRNPWDTSDGPCYRGGMDILALRRRDCCL